MVEIERYSGHNYAMELLIVMIVLMKKDISAVSLHCQGIFP